MAIKVDIIATDKTSGNVKKTSQEFDKLDHSVDKTGKSVQSNTSKMGNAFSKMGGWAKVAIAGAIVAAFAAAGMAIKKFARDSIRHIKEFVGLSTKQEEIFKHLETAIGLTGAAYEKVKPISDKYLSSMQAVTRFGDTELAPSLQQIMLLTGSVSKGFEGAKIAANIASTGLFDLNTASRYVAMAMAGEVTMLGRYIPALKEAALKQAGITTTAAKTAYAMDILNKMFSGAAQKDLEVWGGKIAQVKNYISDIKEAIGDFIKMPFEPYLEKIRLKFIEFADIGWGNVIKAMGEMWSDMLVYILKITGATLAQLSMTMAIIPQAFATAMIVAKGDMTKAIGLVGDSVAKVLTEKLEPSITKWTKELSDKIKDRALEIKNTLGDALSGDEGGGDPIADAGEKAGNNYMDAFIKATERKSLEDALSHFTKRPDLPVGPYEIPKEKAEPGKELTESAKAFENAFMASAQIVADELNSMWDDVFGKAESVFEKMAKTFVTTFINAIIQAEARYAASALLKLLVPGGGSILGALFGFHGGGFVDWAGGSRGGYGAIPKRHSGGLESNEIIAKIQRHEFITQSKSVNSDTRPGLEYINKTGKMPTSSVTIAGDNINISGNVDRNTQDNITRAVKENKIRLAKTIQDLIDSRMVKA
ncbi:MAG TPA: hypothetical protein VMV56_07575 [Williamwhitmania sp.]|nr:hypothetical protein [Williamwhitmania sp.]